MAASIGKRIVFTGGSGKAGCHVIPYLLFKGHFVLNLDLTPLPHPLVYILKTNLTDIDQVFNTFTFNFHINDYSNPRHSDIVSIDPIDAITHFAIYVRNMLISNNECFKENVLSIYKVIKAIYKLGIKKIIIASTKVDIKSPGPIKTSDVILYAKQILCSNYRMSDLKCITVYNSCNTLSNPNVDLLIN